MALQSQTYGNSGNAYYITGADPINPSTNTALYGPVEILFTSTIAGAYHGTLNQTPSSFTISENNANLSTINSLVMDPVVPKTTMNIYDINNPGAEPVIQQWTNVSSIVNGIFKVGNKQLNDEPGALIFQNGVPQSGITRIDAGTTQTFIDGVNNRTRFANQADTTWNVSINQNPSDASISVNSPGPVSIVTQPSVQTFNRNNITYGRTGVNPGGTNQYYMSARTQIDFVTDEASVAPTVLSLKQNGTAVFLSTVFAPTISTTTVRTVDISTTNIVGVNANLDNISTLRVNQKGPAGQPIFVGGSVELRRTAGPNGGAGINALTSPRVIVNDSGVTPKVYYAPLDNQAQLQQGAIGGGGALPDPPPTATNSLEIVASSALTEGGVQFYNAKSGTTPEWMGGFLKNPKSFNVAPAYTANLYGGVSTTTLFANTSISTPIVRVSNFLNVNESGYINVGSNGYISTPVLNATLSTITTNAIASFSHKTPNSIITNANSATVPTPYPQAYGNFQGQFMYNTLRSTFGAPATAFESLEVVNVAGGPQTGGIQFYTSDNSAPANPKWMGGFLQNNVGAGQSEFRLASTITASMPQLVNVSTINTLPITSYGNPTGTILNWAGQNIGGIGIPAGYLLCDGSQVLITTYQNLYNVIGPGWGPNASPGFFRLPDSRGKTLMGSLTVPANCGPAGAYTVTANFVASVSVFLPSTWGGGGRTAIYITNPTGQIFQNMRVATAGYNPNAKVLGFINSDGLYGNVSPTPPANTNPRGTLVIFDQSVVGPNPVNTPIVFTTTNTEINQFPFISQYWDATAGNINGAGSHNHLQQQYEVGSHQHGGTPNTNGGLFVSGAPQAGRGAQTDVNDGLFSYTDPFYATQVSGPLSMYNLPYNMATWQIIKY